MATIKGYMFDKFFMSGWGSKCYDSLVRNSLLPKRVVIADDPIPCDTDFYLMLSIPQQTTIDHKKDKEILRKCLKNASLSTDFDFEVSTLRRFERSSKDQYLLLHTRVYGCAQKVEDHIKHLVEADQIATESLKVVLNDLSIKYDKAVRQYVFYSENLREFEETIMRIFPKMERIELGEHTVVFKGDIVIAISDEDRLISTKLGRMMFDILEEIMNQPGTKENSIDYVINKYKNIVSIDRTMIKKASKKYFFISMAVHFLMILLFLSFVYSYSCIFLSDYALTAAILLILASISGLSIIIFIQLWNKQDVIYK